MQISVAILIANANSGISYVKKLIKSFKARVSADLGIFEAEACLYAALTNLNNIELLRKASLVVTPNAYKASKLYSVVPNTTLGDMDVVRATTATRVNELGLIEVVPRNLLTNSLNLSSGYTLNQCSITSNQTAPDGTSNARRITNGATATDPYFEQSVSFTPTIHTWSVYVKQGTALTATIRPVHVGIGGDVSVMTFTFSTETIVTSGVITTSGFTKLTNGWYRIFCSVNITSAVSSLRGRFGNPSVANVYNDWAYPQLEANTTATEFFPTTTRLNIPRIDYTNASCPSILVEPQRTNLSTYSEEFDNVAWTKTQLTVTANATISPSGVQNADKLIPSNVNSFHNLYNFATALTGSYVFSVFAKKGGYNFLNLQDQFGGIFNSTFDLLNGTITTYFGTATIKSFGNDWFLCTVTGSGTGVTAIPSIIPSNSNSSFPIFTGNGTDGIFVWGAQFEQGSYATSYIPTVASTVTRNADVISKTGISSLIGQTEGTVFVDIDLPNNSANDIFTFSNTGVNDIFLASNGGNLMARIYSNSTPLYFAQFPITSTGGRFKMAISYKSGNSSFYVNGTLLSTNTNTISFTSTLDTINLTNNQYAGLNNKEFNSIQLYKTALLDTEMATLTTI